MYFNLSKNYVKNVFNLGLHLNNIESNIIKENIVNYLHKGYNLVIPNSKHFFVQIMYLIRSISYILQNKGKLMLINTGHLYSGRYKSWFEGLDIVCWEDPWLFGNLSNPRFGLERPDLIIFLSASKSDLQFILDEINVLGVPLINLSKESTDLDLLRINIENNSVCVQFIMQLLYILLVNFNTKAIGYSLSNKRMARVDKRSGCVDGNILSFWAKSLQIKKNRQLVVMSKKL